MDIKLVNIAVNLYRYINVINITRQQHEP